MERLTLSCRLDQHKLCQGFMYRGSIFGEATTCPCNCHKETDR